MQQVILARIGEIALKGLNRSTFEHQLARNMRLALQNCGPADVLWSQSRFYVEPQDDTFLFDLALERLTKVFGLVSLSPARRVASDFDAIRREAVELVGKKLREMERENVSFKVETKRGLKSFPMTSPEISAELGGVLLDTFPTLSVDVNQPDFVLSVEVREWSYLYLDTVPAQGGMPTGSNGKACLLLSGGIDSPVAGYMIGKRGVKLCAVHFHSYPYTSERAKEKVLELGELLSQYCGQIRIFVVPFTEIQLAIQDRCRPELGTVLMRRSMMRIAERLARKASCSALVTGESIGQVASQTMQALYCTDQAVNMPVFRPLIGMDKMEVVAAARRIGTYETSILPYEDCCTVFTPKHPKTRPSLQEVQAEEKRVNFADLEEEAIAGTLDGDHSEIL